jgi:hypothetical protein
MLGIMQNILASALDLITVIRHGIAAEGPRSAVDHTVVVSRTSFSPPKI